MKKFVIMILSVVVVLSLVGCGGKEPAPELTDAEKFAEENGISVELAQSIEDALSQTTVPPSLNKLNEWEQIEDYALGQRYTGWVYSNSQERYYYMVFYVRGNEVESIRDQQNGGDYLYNRVIDEQDSTLSEDKSSPSVTANDLYENWEQYYEQTVYVTGEVTAISEYSDTNGYYLCGSIGKGLVCWIDETEKCANVGDTVKIYGYVRNIGDNQVELTDCSLVK